MSKRLFPDNTAPPGQGRNAGEARDIAISPMDATVMKTPIRHEGFRPSVRNLKNAK